MNILTAPVRAARSALATGPGLAVAIASLLVAGCASQSSKIEIQPAGPAAATAAAPYAKMAVVAGVRRPELRATVEDHVVASLREAGVTAEATYREVVFEQLQQNPAGVAGRLAQQGWPVVLVLRELDQATADRDRAGRFDRYSSDVWVGMLSPDSVEMATPGSYTPGYANAQTVLTLEAKVRDLTTNRGMWSAVCHATLAEDADRLAVLRRFADQLVREMSRAGLVP